MGAGGRAARALRETTMEPHIGFLFKGCLCVGLFLELRDSVGG